MPLDVIAKVELRIVDPLWMRDVARDEREALTETRHEVDAARQVFEVVLVGDLTADDRDADAVHRTCSGLRVKKRCILRRKSHLVSPQFVHVALRRRNFARLRCQAKLV